MAFSVVVSGYQRFGGISAATFASTLTAEAACSPERWKPFTMLLIPQPRQQSAVGGTVQNVVYRPHKHCLRSKKKKSALCGYHVRLPARLCDVVSTAKPPVRLS